MPERNGVICQSTTLLAGALIKSSSTCLTKAPQWTNPLLVMRKYKNSTASTPREVFFTKSHCLNLPNKFQNSVKWGEINRDFPVPKIFEDPKQVTFDNL